MNGGSGNLFKAISSDTRLSILENLNEGDKHISGFAREIGISVHLQTCQNPGKSQTCRAEKGRKYPYDRHKTEQRLFLFWIISQKTGNLK